ncbi:MAG: ferrochelatase [Candidatus Eremiobacteraeota bacterium]|nr:ferrochelatase [Candidatus Eremiobacteraeota bacterium]
MPDKLTAVVLAQLGGPETLADVRPFLYNFFVDLIPDNIPVPAFLIKPTAWLISTVRAPYSRRLYASIGGGSPLRAQSQAQADALSAELKRRAAPLPVYLAMRNWRPFSREALEAARLAGVERLVFVPLYPQYSFSTTRSSLNELQRVMRVMRYEPELRVIDQYCEDADFLAAVADLTRTTLASFSTPARDVHVIFSAHGLPVRYIERGDPYLDQVNRSVAGVAALLDHPGPVHVSFQSRLGPEKWLEPATESLIARLAHDGARAICVVPIAFVSEHVETLNEIDIQYAQAARADGIREFKRVPTVQCHPSYVACLAHAVERALGVVGAPC